jgi:hypothetical protein
MNKPIPDDELLSAYLDDELSPEERARVEQRLATDREYAATLDAFRDQQQRLRALAGSLPEGSIDVRQRVMDAVEAKSTIAAAENRSGQKFNLWVLASLAALVLLGVFLFLPDFGMEQAVVQNDLSDNPAVVAGKVDEKVDDADLSAENEAAVVSKGIAMEAQDPIPASRQSRLERQMASGEEGDEASGSDAEPEFAAVDAAAAKSSLAAADDAQPAQPNDFSMKFHMRQNESLDMAALAGSDVEAAPEKLQQQSNANRMTRSRSAPIAPTFSKPGLSSVVQNEADKQSLRLQAGAAGESELTSKRSASESVFEETTVDDEAEGVKVFKQLEGRWARTWHVRPAGEGSAVALFRQSLELAGCRFQLVRSSDAQSHSSGFAAGPQKDQLVKKKKGQQVDFIVTATPQQLVNLRNSVVFFADLRRLDRMLSALKADEAQSSWDGSLLPRVNGLDPAGDARVYLFNVFPAKELPAKP